MYLIPLHVCSYIDVMVPLVPSKRQLNIQTEVGFAAFLFPDFVSST